jgi:hypothetical protein
MPAACEPFTSDEGNHKSLAELTECSYIVPCFSDVEVQKK